MAKREYETREFGQFAVRSLKAYGRRVADRDVAELKGLADFAELAEKTLGETVAKLRSEEGGSYSWAAIAVSLGISRSAAQHRFEKYGIAHACVDSRPVRDDSYRLACSVCGEAL